MISNIDERNIMKPCTCFFISILVMTGAALILGTVISKLFFALAQTTNSNDIHNISNSGMDLSHKFSIEYNKSIPFIKIDGPHWNVNVTTKPAPHTIPIDNVTYVINLNPGMENGVQVINSREPRNDFEINLQDLHAGINLTATAHYKDGRNITQPLQIQLTCSQEECGSQLNVTPSLIGTNIVKVNGNATAKYGTQIANISVNWGDGTKPFFWPNNTPSISKQFSFSHTYYVIGSYLITIRVTNTRGYEISQNVTTTGLLYQRYLPSDSPLRVSESANAILQVSTTSDVIQSDSHTFVDIKLSYLNGSGIEKQPIDVTAIWIGYPNVSMSVPKLIGTSDTKPRAVYLNEKSNGEYIADTGPNVLPVGKYKIVAQPVGQRYIGFNASKEVTVLAPALTFDQFIGYLSIGVGVGATIIGAAIKVPGYFRGKKQAICLHGCLEKINMEYDKFKNKSNPLQSHKDRYLKDLERLRTDFMNLLASQKITLDQYKVLDDAISTYTNRVK